MAEAVNIANQISNGSVESSKQPPGRPSIREKITQLQAASGGGVSSSGAAPLSRPADSRAGPGSNMRGPRRIAIQRSSAGFGFTLRHFIVYPPDSVSDCPEEWHRGMSAGLLDPMVPMDTIFVKHVKENGPAARAGLATGDQVVSVNGESVVCKSYAQVVQMIQRSGPTLELMVMPKEHDVLQQCFADTAHNPHTNARPVIPAIYAQPDALSSPHVNPMSVDTLKTNILSHLPRPKPYQPFQVEAKKAAAPQIAALQQPRPSSAPLSRAQPLAKDESLSGMHARLLAAALVSESVRKSADFNATVASAEAKAAPAASGSADTMVHPSAMSRNRSSFVDYPASGVSTALSAASKRSSYAGPGTSRAEFILSMNPPTFSVGNAPVTSGVCVRLESNAPGHQSNSLPSVAVQAQAAAETNVHGSTCSLSARRDSLTSSRGSVYSDERSDQVMSRIKKSFEQKEEFLKRPALPYWVNEVQSPPIPKEFYAQPQKFTRPLWPPNCLETSLSSAAEASKEPSANASPPPASSAPLGVQRGAPLTARSQSAETGSTVVTSIEPWSMVFTASKAPASPTSGQPVSPATFIGLVPNTVPKPFVPGGNPYVAPTPAASSGGAGTSRNFVSTLTRIQENIASDASGERRDLDLKLKPTPNTFSAPLASPEEYTPSPTKLLPSRSGDSSGIQAALAALVNETVSKRAKQFEQNGLTRKDASGQSQSPAGASVPLGEKGLLSRIAQRKQETPEPKPAEEKRRQSSSRSRSESPEVAYRPLSGNRTVIIGSSKLHCDPPPDYHPEPPERSSGEKDALCNGKNDSESRKTVLRQHSYRSAVRALNASTSSLASLCQADPVCDPACRPLLRSSSVDENSNSHSSTPKRPSHLHLTSPLVLPGGDDCLCPALAGSAAAAVGGDASSASPASPASPASLSTPPSPIASDFELSVLERFDQLMASLGSFTNHSSPGASGSSSSNGGTTPQDAKLLGGSTKSAEVTPNSITAQVNRRQKIYDDGDDNERAMRRVSYLKATAGDRQHVDSDGEVNESESDQVATVSTPTTAVAEQAKGARPEQRAHPHSIQKLRLLFGDSKASTVSPTSKSPSGHPVSLVQPNAAAAAATAAAVEVASVKDGSPSPNWSADASREGWLNVKQTIVDYRRSTDRSWRQLWAKLRSYSLHFFRDKKDSAHMIVPGTDEMSIDLRGSAIDVALDYTKRKHVLRLTTANGPCEYLLQCEDNNDMILWLQTLQERASDKEDARGSASGQFATPSSGGYSNCEMVLRKQAQELENSAHAANSKGIRKFSAFHRNRSPTGHSPVSKTRKPSLVGEPPPASPNKPKTWKGKVANKFKKIQGSSPNSPSPSQLPEGATIGVPLEDCPRSSVSEHIPLIVELGVGIVEARGLECVGVYRVPGNTAAVTALTESLNRGFDGLNQQDPRWNDVNVISSLLKSFFRKLPDPLITSEYYSSFIEASKTEPDSVRSNALKRLVDELPEPHYSTLRYLILHLARVAKKSNINKMEARNLAIVFGPTLIRPADDNTVTMVTDMSHQCRIVETLIDKCDFFFQEDQLEVSASKSPTATQTNAVPPVDDRKDVYAKEIVSSIILAARRKRQTSTDSPDMSSRPADQSQQSQEDLTEAIVVPVAGSGEAAESGNLTIANVGSAHSLVELGSSGGLPALPVEASESRVPAPRIVPDPEPILIERKRSASLGGEAILQQLADASNVAGAEAGSGGASSGGAESSEPAAGEFRSRTSSGSFVSKNTVHPIDAAGIRSYCGLSAVTQERIRRFEQETKALLQRDLARQSRREVDVPRLDKAQVETAWQRAKIEMETDDLLDALADNPSDLAEQISVVSEQPAEQLPIPPESEGPAEALPVTEEAVKEDQVESLASPAELVSAASDLVVSEASERVAAEEPVSDSLSPLEAETAPAVEESADDQLSEESAEAKPCPSINEVATPLAAAASPVPKTTKSSAPVAGSTPNKSPHKGTSGRSQIPKLSSAAKSFDSATSSKNNSPSTASNPSGKSAAVKSTGQSAAAAKATPTAAGRSTVTSHTVTSRSKTVELPKNKKIEHAKIVRQQSAGAIHPHSPAKVTAGKLPVTPKANPRSKVVDNSSVKRPSLSSMKSVEETPKKSAAPDSSELLRSIASNVDSTVRGFLSTEDEETTCLESTPMNGPLNKDYRNPSLHRARGDETEPEDRNKGSAETKIVGLITATEPKVAVKRPVELKTHDNKVKRSDSLTKDEKTECNTKLARERLNGGSAGRPKRFVQRGESGLKRRHTVGGTRDFDKVRIHWLAHNNNNKELDEANNSAAPRWSAWDRLQPLVSDEDLNVDRSLKTWMRSERMRTSSPELCRRSDACVTMGGCPPLMLLDTEIDPPEEQLVSVPST